VRIEAEGSSYVRNSRPGNLVRSVEVESRAAHASRGARVAVIPARGGSKRIPGKNIRSFLGKPAIAYPIAAAWRSKLFDRVVVSTDSPRIAEIALAHGAEVPFLRPAELADDYCGTLPVLQHALATLDLAATTSVDFVCCIYPTAVLLAENHLVEAFRKLSASPSMAYCFSVCSYPHPTQRALRVTESGVAVAVSPEHAAKRTQDLPPQYHDAGQFYWGTSEAVRQGIPFFSGPSLPYVLRRTEFVDIDDADDWAYAEALAQALKIARRINTRCTSTDSARTASSQSG